jgi:DNA-binding HxlR family transcriptional regulator
MSEVLLRKHFIDIIMEIKEHPKSYNEILKELRIWPDTLNKRLKELKKYKLIESITVKVEDKDRTKYRLTRKGRDLVPKIKEYLKLMKEIEERLHSSNLE